MRVTIYQMFQDDVLRATALSKSDLINMAKDKGGEFIITKQNNLGNFKEVLRVINGKASKIK